MSWVLDKLENQAKSAMKNIEHANQNLISNTVSVDMLAIFQTKHRSQKCNPNNRENCDLLRPFEYASKHISPYYLGKYSYCAKSHQYRYADADCFRQAVQLFHVFILSYTNAIMGGPYNICKRSGPSHIHCLLIMDGEMCNHVIISERHEPSRQAQSHTGTRSNPRQAETPRGKHQHQSH